MRAYDIIYKKREGFKLSKEEIDFLIQEYTRGQIPDYQMSAWAMAVFFKGMDSEETSHLTMAMAKSGDIIDLSEIRGIKVDKHSSGGVGDTTTLVLAPLVAAAGIPVAKMSGRGLGHTGGTIDKLESIPGFKTELDRRDFINIVNSTGVAVAGQTGNLTPADKKLYSLRDVTATVDSIPLIASSIMSKKIAGGADGIVLDVKTGRGAFMENLEDARKLARAMVEIGRQVQRKTIAVITDMNQPLGYAVGNALEVKEAIDTLGGHGPEDLEELCLTLGANMLVIGEKATDFEEGYNKLKDLIETGKALEKFKEFIKAQKGNPDVVDNKELLPRANNIIAVKANNDGYVQQIDAREIGLTVMSLGGGREKKGDRIDPAVGIVLKKKMGDKVNKDELLAEIHINDTTNSEEVKERVQKAIIIGQEKNKRNKLIYEIIE
ncbi:pyrimidine-nucleoside phosphorylase [Halothermothrix orenii]|uniref:Pyrimidine-nucleoside phosphorylase n=1 Tax=Halothermothrix orenii (strain H 168 / OCM 544 / DSM 9562) TaxID=373903 RepID=B8CVY5_HALOH|nr:pyrimidine-nucleoside phosphorylase [Halothermothrix orenii]ACL69454.1 thymidine phosphorylase [Halothermothrix orenii H 168]